MAVFQMRSLLAGVSQIHFSQEARVDGNMPTRSPKCLLQFPNTK
ncbi:hypothetical protein Hanom_Chr06g00552631 [Helianthus anomalus]